MLRFDAELEAIKDARRKAELGKQADKERQEAEQRNDAIAQLKAFKAEMDAKTL